MPLHCVTSGVSRASRSMPSALRSSTGFRGREKGREEMRNEGGEHTKIMREEEFMNAAFIRLGAKKALTSDG